MTDQKELHTSIILDIKKSMTSQQGKTLFLKNQLANILKAKIHSDLYVYPFYVSCKVFLKISSRFKVAPYGFVQLQPDL